MGTRKVIETTETINWKGSWWLTITVILIWIALIKFILFG